jgi:ribosomal protein L27
MLPAWRGSAAARAGDMPEITMVRSTQLFVGTLLMLCAMSPPAVAQTIGARAGVSIDPEQFYFGAHAESPPLVDRLRFRPSIEIGLGSDTTIAAFNVEFAYHFRSIEPWNVYAGAGPALNIITREGDTDAEPGVNVLVGVAHEDGLFAEFKAGALDSPRLKFGIGYALQW